MKNSSTMIDTVRAAIEPRGLFLRGVLHFGRDGPEMADGRRAATVMLVGNIGGSLWADFSHWRTRQGQELADPLDAWSEAVLRALAENLGGEAWFPSEKPWRPFQQWAMLAEGLKASPLGILIHPEFGLWHGYRGALAFAERLGAQTPPFNHHPCDHCPDQPCMPACPAGAITPAGFGYRDCRTYLATEAGQSGCVTGGCLSRAACPVGAGYRYSAAQLSFHMAALTL